MCIYLMYESGTVYSIRQAVPTPYITIAHKLQRIIYDCSTADIRCVGRVTAWIIQIFVTIVDSLIPSSTAFIFCRLLCRLSRCCSRCQ